MSESRYLLSFAALLASALAVCAPLVLVHAIDDPDNAWLGADPRGTPLAIAETGWDPVVMLESIAGDGDAAGPLPAIALKPADPLYAAAAGPEPAAAAMLLPAPADMPAIEPLFETKVETLLADLAPALALRADAPDQVTVADLGEAPQADWAPPLPARRPKPVLTAEIVVAQEKQASEAQASKADARKTQAPKPAIARTAERHERAAPKPGWRPMALAPADEAVEPREKIAPKASGTRAYQSKVWSALARSKPRAGERGSATVTFTIGGNGALRGARVTRSSGNAKLDRMALATVRKAAPFPASGAKSGASSYTIRIDFP